MSTPHIKAETGDIASTVIMPGDPLRAKYVAENYLRDVLCFNNVRGMLGYTGTYNGKKVSVMGSGMGMPSIGIYSYELYKFFGVERIIRAGSIGGMSDGVNLREVIIAEGACTDSEYQSQYGVKGHFAPICDFGLLRSAVGIAEREGIAVKVGNVLSTDVFYNADAEQKEKWKALGVLGVEMESAALYMNASFLNKKALGIFTVSDHLFKGGSLSSDERERSFDDMIRLALMTATE